MQGKFFTTLAQVRILFFFKHATQKTGNKGKNREMKFHYTKKSFYSVKTIIRSKRLFIRWKKIFLNYITDKELVFRIDKQFK